MEYALTANHLMKKYGRSNALDNFSMQVPKGAIYGFVGKNGQDDADSSGLWASITNVRDLYAIWGQKYPEGNPESTPQNGGRRRSPFDLSGSVCRG